LKRRRRVEWKQYCMHLRKMVEKEKAEAEVEEVEEVEEVKEVEEEEELE
jgi:hypothetical protein